MGRELGTVEENGKIVKMMNWIRVKVKNILKRFILIDGYCKRCGDVMVPIFTVSDTLWNLVTEGDRKEYCIKCFNSKARDCGIGIIWTDKETNICR